MVVEVSVERLKTEIEERDTGYKWYKDRHELFTVHVGEKRILTVFTVSTIIMTKWISEIRKAYRKKKKQPLVVGFCVDRELHYDKSGLRDNPYDVLTLCIGSHCLIYSLPEGNNFTRGYFSRYSNYCEVPKALKDFLADSNTICVGMDSRDVAEKLEKDQEVKIARSVDLYRLMVNAVGLRNLPRGVDFDDLNEISKLLLGKEMDVVRNKVSCPRGEPGNRSYEINREYVKYLTVDAFFAREIGMKHLDRLTKLSSPNQK